MSLVSKVYSSLYHYTTWEGLSGILESQKLFATHVRYLNDDSEYKFAGSLLQDLLLPQFRKLIGSLKHSESLKEQISAVGGLENYCRQVVGRMVHLLYKVTGEEFYVISFCGNSDDEYTNQNGLLSQWRAYGSIQGFALEFDTEKMEELFQRETAKHSYGSNSFGDVVYGINDPHFDEDYAPRFQVLLEYLKNLHLQILGENGEPRNAEAYTAFCYCAMMLKHEGF